jgi:hypothetical protein
VWIFNFKKFSRIPKSQSVECAQFPKGHPPQFPVVLVSLSVSYSRAGRFLKLLAVGQNVFEKMKIGLGKMPQPNFGFRENGLSVPRKTRF